MSTVPIDTYILDTLVRELVGHDRAPSAFLVYLFLWNETHGRKKATVQVALLDMPSTSACRNAPCRMRLASWPGAN